MRKFGFIFFFERIVWYYNFMVDCKFPTYSLVTEKLLKGDENTADSLLKFCNLSPENINYKSIDKKRIKHHDPTYINYRFANFLWKRLSSFFKVYDINETE